MAVPAPSIKPPLLNGSAQTLCYAGACGVGPIVQSTTAIVIVEFVYEGGGSPPTYTNDAAPGQKMVLNGKLFTIESIEYADGPWFGLLHADDPGPVGALDAASRFTFQPSSASQRWNGAKLDQLQSDGQLGSGSNALNIDLTNFSRELRASPYFADNLMVIVKSLDAGLVNAGPFGLQNADFHGTPIEYVTVAMTSSDMANECAILIYSPHSTGR